MRDGALRGEKRAQIHLLNEKMRAEKQSAFKYGLRTDRLNLLSDIRKRMRRSGLKRLGSAK